MKTLPQSAETRSIVSAATFSFLGVPKEAQSQASSTSAWYLVHTKPRQEQLAQLNLERQGYDCYLPKLTLEKIRRSKLEMVTEAMFPRYLFIQLDTSEKGKSWSPIRSTLGVSGLVNFGGLPARAQDQLIHLLRSREEVTDAESLFQQGDKVIVTDGPFGGLEAIYHATNAEQRSIILLNILSKSVTLQIAPERLTKVG